jgi:mannosyltransferase OCH1-like enzyme
MIPKILHQCKAAPNKHFSWEERRLAKKAQELMPEWNYCSWMDEDNIALVEQICPRGINEYLRFPNGAIKADVARYLYMYRYGGIYFDTDFLFFQPIRDDLLSHLCILGVEDENMPELGGGPKLGNAFIGSQPGLALWTELVDSIFMCFRKGEIYPYAWQLSGPYALTAFLRNHNRYAGIVTILPRNVLYPKLKNLNLTGARDPDTIGVHLMWGSWRDMSLPHMVKNRTRRILSAALA